MKSICGSVVVMEQWNYPDITGTVSEVEERDGVTWWKVGDHWMPASKFLWFADK